MVYGRSRSTNSPPQLPSLGTEQNGNHPQSAWLRGSAHPKVPEITNQPLNTMLPILPNGAAHPQPYYITQNVVLTIPSGRPPWLENIKTTERLVRDTWKRNEALQNAMLDEFIKDTLHAEIVGIVSSTLTENQSRHKGETKLLKWLDEHVITDQVYNIIEVVAWEALWDQAKKLRKREIDDLEAQYKSQPTDSHMLNILRDNYTHPLDPHTGKSLINHSWGELLYHTNRYMRRGTLAENYAIGKLQQRIVSQVAAKVMLDESIKTMEEEMKNFDELQRVEDPLRKIN